MNRIHSGSFQSRELIPWQMAELLLPEYTKAQFKDLEEFIAAGGQMPPIVISEDKRIVDGYNRWRTANRLGLSEIECDMYHYEDEKDMEHHAIVLNSKRRHLSNIQVARAASRLSDIFVQEKIETINAPIEEVTPVESEPAGLFDEKVEVEIAVPAEPKEAPTAEVVVPMPKEQKNAMKKASRKLRISSQTVERVQQVDATKDSQLISAMETKQVSLKQAADLAQLPEEERHNALDELQKEKEPDAGNTKVVVNACTTCMSRLKSCAKKLDLSMVSEERKEELKGDINKVIEEANALLFTITNYVREEESTQAELES